MKYSFNDPGLTFQSSLTEVNFPSVFCLMFRHVWAEFNLMMSIHLYIYKNELYL
jgi:hypothetical protein